MSAASAWLRAWIAKPEVGVCHALNRWGRSQPTRNLFRCVSRLGDGPVWYALIFGLASLGGTTGLMAALHLAAIGLISWLLYRSLKRWTQRPRPFAQYQSIQAHIAPLDEFSFPSGHTLHATAFSLVACSYYPALAWILVPFTLLVALSRVILGLHYPTDVLAAFAIGATLAAASLLLV
ncbi:MAG: phosphatase PAP2 family protein [Pseudomonadota bacterium]|nr:phosphatase PAP2 family protein [Pseudomonadota bacterium]